jgi:tRNA-dihydrouridine synthase
MSHFPARWEEIGKAVQLRNSIAPNTKIIGNGDVISYQDGLEKIKQFGVDGVMIGRGIFKNPWIFNPNIDPNTIQIPERMDLLKYHVELFEGTWGKSKNFHLLKKFFKIYVHGLPNAAELRDQLMRVENASQALTVAIKIAASK